MLIRHNDVLCVALIVITLGLTVGCSKQETGKEKGAEAPSINAALSPQNAQKAVEAKLPKGDKSKPLDAYTKLTSGNQLMYAYIALANLPVDYEKIATHVSQEYRSTLDGFKKQDILTALKPRIDGEIAKAKDVHYVRYDDYYSVFYSPLSNYNFERKGFNLTTLKPGTFFYFQDNQYYQLTYTNAEKFNFFSVTDQDKARNIESIITNSKGMHIYVYSYQQEADVNRKEIKAEILHIQIADHTGKVFLEM